MSQYLLDTNICVELLRGRAKHVFLRLRECPEENVAISSITLAELEYGVARTANPEKHAVLLANFCAPLEILPFDQIAATVYGMVRATLEHEGNPIGPLDTLIASHALALQRTVITNNIREFKRVSNLKVENWLH